MLRKIVLLCCLLSLTILTQAQDSTPPLVRDAALDAAEDARGLRANNWRFEALNPTTDSALGCPLVEGETLPFEVTPYRMSLLYPDGIYVVLVSIDGQIVQLCDEKFGDAMTAPTADDADACTLTAQAATPAYAAPDTRVAGLFSSVAGTTYEPFSRSADSNWYQIGNEDGGIGWVDATAFTQAGDCSSLTIGAYTALNATTACYVTPAAAFSNIRNQPTTDSAQVAQIFENAVFQVSAQTTNADWFFILPGWVASSVIQTIGTCDSVTIDPDRVGAGFTDETTAGAADATVALALAQYSCPANFEGYLEPRIRVGFGTAAVQTGGVPNTLRNFPDADDAIGARLGTIQPGRTLDRVINGPVCNQGFVWWQVEIDGQTGWTAESNVATGDYFLEAQDDRAPQAADTDTTEVATATPIAVEAVTTEAPADETPIVLAQAQPGVPVAGALFTLQQGNLPIVDLALDPVDNSTLYVASDLPDRADGVGGIVQIWNLSDGQVATRFEVTGDALYVTQANSGSRPIVVAGSNGVVSIVDPGNLALLELVETTPDAGTANSQFALSDDGAALVATSCADAECTTSLITLYTTANGASVWATQQPDHLIKGLVVSGETLATVGDDGAKFWSLVDGTLLREYPNPTGLPINAIALSADGTQGLLVGCEVGSASDCSQGRIALLDTSTPALLGVLTSHSSAIEAVAYSASGARFATSDGNEVIVRDSSGVETGRYSVPDATITAFTIAETADGARLIAGTDDGRVAVWGI